jgi:hypothetical protein
MLDIIDRKTGKVIAVLMDDGTVIKKDKATDDIDEIIRKRIEEIHKERK